MADEPNETGEPLDVEQIDLAELTEALREQLAGAKPLGYLDGRTALRDAVAERLRCSQLQAEELVDTLIARGFARYQGDPQAELDDASGWSLAG